MLFLFLFFYKFQIACARVCVCKCTINLEKYTDLIQIFTIVKEKMTSENVIFYGVLTLLAIVTINLVLSGVHTYKIFKQQ